MRTEELLEHADYLLGAAAGKCDSWDDAQDLVQAVLLEGLLAVRSGKKIDSPRNWLVTVLNRRFYDMLREKYRKPLVFCGLDYDPVRDTAATPDLPEDREEMTEEENLRRLVARMTGTGRPGNRGKALPSGKHRQEPPSPRQGPTEKGFNHGKV